MIRQLVLSGACALGLSMGLWAQCDLQQLLSADPAAGDRLGSALAIDGALAIAGAPYDDDGGSDAGSAHIFRHDGTQWGPEQKLVAGDAMANDHFGAAVAIVGTLALVGAPEDDEVTSNAGSVHVFRYDGVQWVLEQKLANPDPGSSENFGSSVATNGIVVAVGCKRDGALASGAGAVYIYRKVGSTWTLEKKLTASDIQTNGQFGVALAVDADAVVVGAWQHSEAATFTGAAYIYRESGGTWPEEQKLVASDGQSFDRFGISVDVVGDLIAVGAYRAADQGVGRPGAVYVFRRGATWIEEQKLVPSDWIGEEFNGWSCGVSATRVAVGSRRNWELGNGSGAVYLFDHDGVRWKETVKLAVPFDAVGNELGYALGLSGDRLLAGARWADAAGYSSGAVWAWDSPGEGCLAGGPDSISLAPGGSHEFYLAGGLAHAGDIYLVLGSFSGTSPGLVFDGQPLPLNFDLYTLTLITTPTLISGGLRILGTAGQAQASLVVPAGAGPSLVGVMAHHAFLVIDPALVQVTLTSNAAPLVFTP